MSLTDNMPQSVQFVLKRALSKLFKNTVMRSVLILVCFFFYCESVHYYLVLLQCAWPSFAGASSSAPEVEGLKAMFLADTHLLGFRQGHWFDKLRREWQMKQAFQATMFIHQPDIVFVLGDLFDEGKWCDDEEFYYHTSRFRSMFAVPKATELYAVAGNHDEGFHYMMTEHKHKRFEAEFKSPSVRLVTKKDVSFVLLNSMAMEGDGCRLCAEAERQLRNISKHFTTLKNCHLDKESSKECRKPKMQQFYTQPILLQHFPMYRPSDADCSTPDAPPLDEKYLPFRQKFDCIDERSSHLLLQLLQPRLVVDGHTHHGCYRTLPGDVPEWTVSSFSWRNRNNPTFLMARISRDEHIIAQCFLPQESTVITLYYVAGACTVLSLLMPLFIQRKRPKVF